MLKESNKRSCHMNIISKVKYNINMWKYSILAFLLSAVAVIISFSLSKRMFFGNYSVMEGDFLCQQFPVYIEYIRKILNGDAFIGEGNFWYTFQYSMGSDIYAQLNFFSCLNPFVLFYLLPNSELASELMIICKLATAGGMFSVFCQYCYKKNNLITVVFSVAYALCGYNVMFYINSLYLEGVYMLPLILLLLYRLIKTKKWIGLTIAYAYIFMNSFYVGYLVGIFSFVVFIFYILLVENIDKKQKWKIFGIFVISVLAAVMLSAFILLPTAFYVLSNIVPDRTKFQGLNLNLIDILGNLFLGINQGRVGFIPYIYSGIIVLFTTPYFFISSKTQKKYKFFASSVLLFLFLCCLINPLYLLMHCFDAPNNSGFRFAYIISFELLAIGVWIFEECIDKIEKKHLLIISGAWLFVMALAYVFQNKLIADNNAFPLLLVEINGVCIALCAAYFYYQNRFKTKIINYRIFSICFYMEILLNAYMVLIMNTYDPIEYLDNFNRIINQNQEVSSDISELEGDNFYRVTIEEPFSQNAQMIFNQNGISSFSSFENFHLRETLNKLGYAASARNTLDYGGTDFTKMIFSQKYILHTYCVTYNGDIDVPYFTTQENTLSLGFMCHNSLKDFELNDNPIDNQNLLLNQMTDLNDNLFLPVEVEINCELDNLVYDNLESSTQKGLMLVTNQEEGTAAYTFDGEDRISYYCYLPVEKHGKFEGYPLIYSFGGDIGNSLTNPIITLPHMIKIGKNENGQYNVGMYITNDMVMKYIPVDEISIVYQDESVLQSAYDVLSKHQLVIDEWKDGYVKGNISVEDGSNVLFLSIPYEKGWEAYVDGKETEITPVVNNTFISIDLSVGEHEIELVYKNKYGEIGMWISLGGILILGVIVIIKRKNKRCES